MPKHTQEIGISKNALLLFAIHYQSLMQGGDTVFSEEGPSIALVTEGELVINRDSGKLRLSQGESVFIPAGAGELRFSGAYTLYVAGAGGTTADGKNP